jgi:lysophospholipid acyltransferase (LPLAT)-like uncharacterized protein
VQLSLRVFVIWIVFSALRRTWRIRVVGSPPSGATLYAFWHGDLFALTALGRWIRQHRPHVLVSLSRDGDLAARIAERIGLGVVRGSSSRGAVAAGKRLVELMRDGQSAALAADGPRGPRHQCDERPLRLARLARTQLVGVAAVARRCWRLRSWDQLAIPRPFAKVVVVWGTAVATDVEGSLVALRRRAAQLAGCDDA